MISRLAVLALCVGILFSVTSPVNAQEREPVEVAALGPQIGEKIPNFALPDQHGRIQTLDSIMGEKGAMIVFHRSADW